MEKTCTGQNVHPSCRVNLLSERLIEKKADSFFQANSARACSNCLKQLEHALIASPRPSLPGWARQSVYIEKIWPG